MPLPKSNPILLTVFQRLLQTILEQAAEGITVRDAEGRATFVNTVARRRAMVPPEGTTLEMAPEVWGEYRDADGKPVPIEQWPMMLALHGETVAKELQRVTPAGSMFVLNSAGPLKNDKGEIIGAVAITTDITERRRTEDRLRQALADKDALLREVHHRVKNNLQMLCDLMYLQMETLEDREQHQYLQDAYGRIYAIARLHEQLYQSMHSGAVLLGEYLARLVSGFENLASHVPIRLDVPAQDRFALDVDRAIHTGLIVNELVTNALKHAFPDGRKGEVVVALRTMGNQLELQVRDNGKGLPADVGLEHTKSLGLRIVHIPSRRLQATVSVQQHNGASFTITFPLQAAPAVEPLHS